MASMWTVGVSLIVTFCCLLTCHGDVSLQIEENKTRSLVVAHDVPAGFGIDRWSFSPDVRYQLLESPLSDRFAMVHNGLLVTTSKLNQVLQHPQPLTLYLIEDTPIRKSTHTVQVYVVDRQQMPHFSKTIYYGRIAENAPAGSVVEGLEDLHVMNAPNASSLQLDIMAGSEFFGVKQIANSSRLVLMTNQPLDRETKPFFDLIVRAQNDMIPVTATCRLIVAVQDVNDNRPVFAQDEYQFWLSETAAKYDRIGQVVAHDADGDDVVYRLVKNSNSFVIVPQTGHILLLDNVSLNKSYVLQVTAKDRRTPSLESEKTARVIISSRPEEKHVEHEQQQQHNIVKRRAPRALRPTKRIEFTEADGTPEGKLMFQLEKSLEKERFKIRDDNPWVTVEPNGNVRVKRKWDYEELGPEKTIDFWVTITNTEGGGE